MGAGFAVILLGIIIILLVPFIYFGIRMAGYPKAALGISIGLFLLIAVPMLKYAYRGQMYSNEDAINDFRSANLTINGPFKILENDISGIKRIEQKAQFLLDTSNVNQIISRLKKQPNFHVSPTHLDLRKDITGHSVGKTIRAYRYKNCYYVETFDQIDDYTTLYSSFEFKAHLDTVKFHKIELN